MRSCMHRFAWLLCILLLPAHAQVMQEADAESN